MKRRIVAERLANHLFTTEEAVDTTLALMGDLIAAMQVCLRPPGTRDKSCLSVDSAAANRPGEANFAGAAASRPAA